MNGGNGGCGGETLRRSLTFKKAGQPLDQSFADHDLIDDFTLVVDQVERIASGTGRSREVGPRGRFSPGAAGIPVW